MSKRIFVSSSCYDLIDLRAEVYHCILQMGLAPLMSDEPRSDFEIPPQKDSISACLHNVQKSDAFVCILSQRYGPSLISRGFDDVSATHLEYREAVAANVPIHFFVRDRLAAEQKTYQHARKLDKLDDLALGWVRDKKDYPLFDLLDERSHLVKNVPNWYHTFTNSVDLKLRLQGIFSEYSRRALIEGLIRQNLLPWFSFPHFLMRQDAHTVAPKIRNTGSSPALDVEVQMQISSAREHESFPESHPKNQVFSFVGTIGPGEEHGPGAVPIMNEMSHPAVGNKRYHFKVVVRYTAVTGHRFEDIYIREPLSAPEGSRIRLRSRLLLEGDSFAIG